MATVLDLINDAFALIGELDSSSTMSAADTQQAFRALNRMFASWSNDRSFVYSIRSRTIPLTAGVAAYSSSLLTVRPIKIEEQSINDANGVSYPLEQVGAGKWQGIVYPAAPGYPFWMYIESTATAQTYNLYPTPLGGLTLELLCWELLTTFATTSDVVSLPPGYEDAIVYNLAERIAPFFNRPVPEVVTRIAGQTRAVLESTNLPLVEAEMSGVPTSTNNGFNWKTGETT